MTRPPSSALAAGLLASFVAYASSFSVILQGLRGAGASEAEAAAGLMALSVIMGITGIVMCWRSRLPLSIAWSTPGAALLASAGSPSGGFAVAVGAFLVAGALMLLAGLVRPLGRLVTRIPLSLASAMLAGILLPLCLAPVRALASEPWAALAIAGTWLLVGLWKRMFAVPAAALVAFGIIASTGPGVANGAALGIPQPVFVVPEFTAAAILGLGVPLFLVNMASQTIPGIAVMRVNGYDPDPGSIFSGTGLATILSAPFGGHAVNLAAMTAAICAGDEAGPDRDRRWWAGVVSGMAYIVFGLSAGTITAFAAQNPLLVQAIAGLALIGALSASLNAAMAKPGEREAATLCFLVTSSGTVFFAISAPFWGLLAGGAMLLLQRRR
ncbi:benzoate/H(+) symporter BenE family transporter [Aureimonas sp. ME7]|uniref:benzoate/H(+) symporter BenE family transporter n=1 Tax=Aureimonas sp. ME7 TaxID=2744252 RepID=UPI0015F5DAFA|nr:benzoate/H(+) symporter BenE family transporter [Aureimonas sp. ME7]